jgi:hypothetical protein
VDIFFAAAKDPGVCKNPAITLVEACSRNHPLTSAPDFIVKGAFLWIHSGHQGLVKIC